MNDPRDAPSSSKEALLCAALADLDALYRAFDEAIAQRLSEGVRAFAVAAMGVQKLAAVTVADELATLVESATLVRFDVEPAVRDAIRLGFELTSALIDGDPSADAASQISGFMELARELRDVVCQAAIARSMRPRRDSVVGDIVAAYVEMANQRMDKISALVAVLVHRFTDAQCDEAVRELHTLKGESNVMGFPLAGEILHALELGFERARSDKASQLGELDRCVTSGFEAVRAVIADGVEPAAARKVVNVWLETPSIRDLCGA